MSKIKELCTKYRELIVYLIVGVATTVFSWGVCFLVEHFWLDSSDTVQNFIINTIGWVAGVLFSYPLSRKWVFRSTNPKVFAEFFGFAASRLSTWVMDLFIMWITVNVWKMNYWIAKVFISAVIVTIANYVFSKFLIFNKKSKKEKED